MNVALLAKIDKMKHHLQEVYDENNQQTTSEAVLKASQDLDILIVEYLKEQMLEKKMKE